MFNLGDRVIRTGDGQTGGATGVVLEYVEAWEGNVKVVKVELDAEWTVKLGSHCWDFYEQSLRIDFELPTEDTYNID